MKRLFLTTLMFNMLLATATAQFPVDTARINKAYNALASEERDAGTEMEFLEAFPTTWLEFYYDVRLHL